MAPEIPQYQDNPSNFLQIHDAVINYYRAKLRPDQVRNRAMVYGQVRRYSRMRKGYCDAAIETMANQIALAPYSFRRHLKALLKDGWIDCLYQSKGGRSRPSHYVPTLMLEALNDKLSAQKTLSPREGNGPKPSHHERVLGKTLSPTNQNPLTVRGKETIRRLNESGDEKNQETTRRASISPRRKEVKESMRALVYDLRDYKDSVREDDLRARIAEDRRNGKARANPLQEAN